MRTLDDIGARLVRARRDRGLTQRDLGVLVGVKQQQIARWEKTAYQAASLERVRAVAAALGVGDHPEADVPLAAEDTGPYGGPGAAELRRAGLRPDVLAAFARSHGIARMELFGSVLGGGFGPASDLDVLVTYEEGRGPSLLGAADQELELSAIAGRPVDLVSRSAVEASGNRVRREAILGNARTVYVSR